MVNLWLIYVTGWWWLENEWIIFPETLGKLIPTDDLFQRGGYTTNQLNYD